MSLQTKKKLVLTLLIGNLLFIWINSVLPREISAAFSQTVGAWIRRIFQLQANISEGTGHGRLRKLAHFAEFFSLGALLHWRCRLQWNKALSVWVLPVGLGVAVAAIDEIIQLFVDRGAGIKDVCIDSCGVVAGVLLWGLILTLSRKKSYKKA